MSKYQINIGTVSFSIPDATSTPATLNCPITATTLNATSLTNNCLVRTDGSKNLTSVTTGTDGQVMTLVSGAPAWAAIPSASSIIGTSIGVSASNNQVISNSTATTVTFLNGTSGNYSSTGTPNISYSAGTYTNITEAKTVLVIFSMVFASNATGYRQAIILKNGTNYAYGHAAAVNGNDTMWDTSAIMRLAVGDTITFTCFQTSGGNLSATGGAGISASTRSVVTVLSL